MQAKAARGALMIHLAMEHGQLKELLEKDEAISEKFVERLYRVSASDCLVRQLGIVW